MALVATMMGGGPRTFPGGITKWEWAKQQRKRRQLMERAQRQRLRDVAEERRRQKELKLALELESRSLEKEPHQFVRRDGTPSTRLLPADAVYSTAPYSRRKIEPHPILDATDGDDDFATRDISASSLIQELIADETG